MKTPRDRAFTVSTAVRERLKEKIESISEEIVDLLNAETIFEQREAVVLLAAEIGDIKYISEEGERLLNEICDQLLKNPS